MYVSPFFVLGISITTLMPLACLWDYDTLKMERIAVPTAHEAIVGYFVRHSDEYYQWRIKNRLAIPVEQRSPSDYDDIAVALEKLGRHDEAIQTIEEKIERWPEEDRYESEANLATFLIHSGRLSDGLTHIDRALRINPDAHFGREIYQKRLVEYLIESNVRDESEASETTRMRFDEYLFRMRDEDATGEETSTEYGEAVEGLIGMLRFGNHDSPILLAALGDLLSSHLPPDDRASANANRLAARAYLVAARFSEEPARSQHRESAKLALQMQVGETLPQIEKELKQELDQASSLQARIAADESTWVAEDANLDERFEAKYGEIPPLSISLRSQVRNVTRWLVPVLGISIVAALAIAWRRRRTSGLGKNSGKA